MLSHGRQGLTRADQFRPFKCFCNVGMPGAALRALFKLVVTLAQACINTGLRPHRHSLPQKVRISKATCRWIPYLVLVQLQQGVDCLRLRLTYPWEGRCELAWCVLGNAEAELSVLNACLAFGLGRTWPLRQAALHQRWRGKLTEQQQCRGQIGNWRLANVELSPQIPPVSKKR